MMILQLSEAGWVISDALGWREGEQRWARKVKGRGIINLRPQHFLAPSLWQFFSGLCVYSITVTGPSAFLSKSWLPASELHCIIAQIQQNDIFIHEIS